MAMLDDQRRDPDNRRLGQFRSAWRKAERGDPIDEATLEQRLTWNNLGWRLGNVFAEVGPTSDAMVKEFFDLCVEQHEQTGRRWRTR